MMLILVLLQLGHPLLLFSLRRELRMLYRLHRMLRNVLSFTTRI